jgi:hypothetical protein
MQPFYHSFNYNSTPCLKGIKANTLAIKRQTQAPIQLQPFFREGA